MKAADLELQVTREDLMTWGEEMRDEGLSDRDIVGNFCNELEERLARLYCEFYELQAETT